MAQLANLLPYSGGLDLKLLQARKFATNLGFVIAAYAAMWIFIALFAVSMFVRQKTLQGELAVLRAQLANTAEG